MCAVLLLVFECGVYCGKSCLCSTPILRGCCVSGRLTGCCTCFRIGSYLSGESLRVEWYISVDVSSNFGALWDGDVFAMHEQKEWSSREKDNGGPDYRTRHRARLTTPPLFFVGSQK